MEEREMLTSRLAEQCLGRRLYGPLEQIEREFSGLFLDEKYCRELILKGMHGDDPRCPRCMGELSAKQKESFWNNDRICCSTCTRYFTALTDTMFSNTRMTFSEIVFLLFFLTQRYPAQWIAKRIGLDVSSVRIWRNKFAVLWSNNAG